jgi:hypothetical protein
MAAFAAASYLPRNPVGIIRSAASTRNVGDWVLRMSRTLALDNAGVGIMGLILHAG